MPDISFSQSKLMLISGSGNQPLANEIAEHIGQPLSQVALKRFADGELFVRLEENARGRDVFIIQPTNPPADNLVELLLLLDAAKRASAARITAVIPYFGYGRQDRKDQPRVAISAKLMADLITRAGADRVLSVDFHQHQIQGFFDIPVDHLYAAPVLVKHFADMNLNNLAIVAPDVGSAKMARGFAKRLNASFAIIDKRRPTANVAEVVNVVGEVDGRDCLIADDMIDTAGTMTQAVHALKELGAKEVYCCATHALFSEPAKQRFEDCPVSEVTVCNTIDIPAERTFAGMKVLSVAPLISKAITYTHANESVSSLFEI